MWPFKKKIQLEVRCIAKQILADIGRVDVSKWVITPRQPSWSVHGWDVISHYIFNHFDLEYGICLNVYDEDGSTYSVSIVDVDYHFNQLEIGLISEALFSVRSRLKIFQENQKKEENNKKLRTLFPNCHNPEL